jgi:hypothetical protein
VALEERLKALLAQTMGIDRGGVAAQERGAICVSTLQNTVLAPGQKVAS